MRDGWLISIRSRDADSLARARAIVEQLKPVSVEELPT
jgi:hypothetical protein